MNKRVFNRNGYLYLDSQKDGIRQRISTSLKASVEANAFLAKKGIFELFFKDKTKALKMWRDYADVVWDKIQKSKSELAKEKLIKKGNERFFIKNAFESYEKERNFFLAPRTQINYKSAKLDIISFFETVGVFDLRELKREHTIDYILNLKKRGLIKSTILNRMKFLKSFLKFCVENELLNKSPFFLPKITDLQDSIIQEPFNLDEIQSLIKEAQGILRSYLIVAFFTGARTSEILGLKCSDLDFEECEIHLQRTKQGDRVREGLKTSLYRFIDMLPIVKNELQNLTINLKKDDFVFSVRSEKLRKDFKALCKELNIKERRLYDTRHSFASVMLSKGEEPMWVGVRMLGHSTLTTTYKYYAKYLPKKISARANFLNELDINQKTKAKNIS